MQTPPVEYTTPNLHQSQGYTSVSYLPTSDSSFLSARPSAGDKSYSTATRYPWSPGNSHKIKTHRTSYLMSHHEISLSQQRKLGHTVP